MPLLIISVGALAVDHVGHEQYHDEAYSHWNQPGTDISCCNARKVYQYPEGPPYVAGDCYPTAMILIKGEWWGLLDPETDDYRYTYIKLPENKRIHEKNPDQTGQSGHLCEDASHNVLCWVPPTGGS